jgi:hypothetical protein
MKDEGAGPAKNATIDYARVNRRILSAGHGGVSGELKNLLSACPSFARTLPGFDAFGNSVHFTVPIL